MVFVAGANLENPRNPVVFGALPRLHRLVGVPLALNGRAVGDKDEALAVVLNSIYWEPGLAAAHDFFPGVAEVYTYKQSCCTASYPPTSGWV